MISTADRRTVRTRAKGLCELCGLPCPSPHLHHRQARGLGAGGINTPSNLLYLHPSCHLKHIEAKRALAYENGWLVRHGANPAEVPVRYMLDSTVLLRDDGSIDRMETMISR